MISNVTCFALAGLEGVPVTVETDVNKGVPAFEMVGLPDAFFDMLPFVITALVLLVASIRGTKRRRIRQNLGNNYLREER